MGIQDVYVLSEEEGLVLRAVEAFNDTEQVRRGRGLSQWSTGEPPPSSDKNIKDIKAQRLLCSLTCDLTRGAELHDVAETVKHKSAPVSLSFTLLALCCHGNPSVSQSHSEEEEVDEQRVKRFRSSGVFRRPGDRWMLRGPIEYVPPATVEVVLKRQAIPLDENEGIYVRDIKTGKVATLPPL